MSPVSIRPKDAIQGGALPIGIPMTIKESRFAPWDYNGQAPATVALKQILVDPDEGEHTQYWSVGSPDRYEITNDGRDLEGPPISKGCNFNLYIGAAVTAGMPEAKLENVASFDGVTVVFTAIPAPKRQGITGQKEGSVVYVPEKITLPAAKGAKAAPAKATTKAAPSTGEIPAEVVEGAMLLLEAVLKSKGGKCEKKDLSTAIFTKDSPLAESKVKKEVGSLIFKPTFEEFLLSNGYQIEGNTISKIA